ncbi:MAG: ABC transporter substrate-binding protein [Chloroflexota bacterium]
MKRVGTILKRIGKFLLWTLLVLAVFIGAFVIWLRIEPAEVTECDPGYQLVKNGTGTDCVPDSPERIMLSSPIISQFFIAVEQPSAMMVVAWDRWSVADIPGLYERLREVNKDAVDLGDVQSGAAQNLELLLLIDPDVIIAEYDPGTLEKPAETIAPVLALTHLNSWKEMTLFAGDLIGERGEAERLLAEYESRVEILQAQFDDTAAITISNVALFQGQTSVQLPASFSGAILQDVGFAFPEPQQALIEETPDLAEIDVSDELIDLIDADYLFIYGGLPNTSFEAYYETSTASIVDAFRNDPLFQFLDAEGAERVKEVDMYWKEGGIYSAHAVLDDLFRYVAGVDPEEVAPNPLLLEH